MTEQQPAKKAATKKATAKKTAVKKAVPAAAAGRTEHVRRRRPGFKLVNGGWVRDRGGR